MKIRLRHLLLSVSAFVALVACQKSGACEYDNKNGVWVCTDDIKEDICTGDRFTADATCESLGYKKDGTTWAKK